MTVFKIEGTIGKKTSKRSDRGGKEMNLLNIILMKSDSGDRRKQHVNQRFNPADDHGYQLYESLEYNTRHGEKHNAALEQIPVNTFIR